MSLFCGGDICLCVYNEKEGEKKKEKGYYNNCWQLLKFSETT